MRLSIAIFILIFSSCSAEDESPIVVGEPKSISDQIITGYDLLPENQISISADESVYATYTDPTEKYGHGILGDRIEAEQLVVVKDGIFYEFKLEEDEVYEDIRPRLYDVDGDNELEIISIRSNLSLGAGIVIYKLADAGIIEYAFVPEIGTSSRWLNIVAIDDLDNDGTVELAWIQTPHIGGILKVAKIEAGTLQIVAEDSQYSNHAIGERNLCLSTVTEMQNQKRFYVPNQDRDKIVGFTFSNDDLNIVEEITMDLDFSATLSSQYSFENVLESNEDNCIVE